MSFIIKKTNIKSHKEFVEGIRRASLKKLSELLAFISGLEDHAAEKLNTDLEPKARKFWTNDHNIAKNMIRSVMIEMEEKANCKCVFFCQCYDMRLRGG